MPMHFLQRNFIKENGHSFDDREYTFIRFYEKSDLNFIVDDHENAKFADS